MYNWRSVGGEHGREARGVTCCLREGQNTTEDWGVTVVPTPGCAGWYCTAAHTYKQKIQNVSLENIFKYS